MILQAKLQIIKLFKKENFTILWIFETWKKNLSIFFAELKNWRFVYLGNDLKYHCLTVQYITLKTSLDNFCCLFLLTGHFKEEKAGRNQPLFWLVKLYCFIDLSAINQDDSFSENFFWLRNRKHLTNFSNDFNERANSSKIMWTPKNKETFL